MPRNSTQWRRAVWTGRVTWTRKASKTSWRSPGSPNTPSPRDSNSLLAARRAGKRMPGKYGLLVKHEKFFRGRLVVQTQCRCPLEIQFEAHNLDLFLELSYLLP